MRSIRRLARAWRWARDKHGAADADAGKRVDSQARTHSSLFGHFVVQGHDPGPPPPYIAATETAADHRHDAVENLGAQLRAVEAPQVEEKHDEERHQQASAHAQRLRRSRPGCRSHPARSRAPTTPSAKSTIGRTTPQPAAFHGPTAAGHGSCRGAAPAASGRREPARSSARWCSMSFVELRARDPFRLPGDFRFRVVDYSGLLRPFPSAAVDLPGPPVAFFHRRVNSTVTIAVSIRTQKSKHERRRHRSPRCRESRGAHRAAAATVRRRLTPDTGLFARARCRLEACETLAARWLIERAPEAPACTWPAAESCAARRTGRRSRSRTSMPEAAWGADDPAEPPPPEPEWPEPPRPPIRCEPRIAWFPSPGPP